MPELILKMKMPDNVFQMLFSGSTDLQKSANGNVVCEMNIDTDQKFAAMFNALSVYRIDAAVQQHFEERKTKFLNNETTD